MYEKLLKIKLKVVGCDHPGAAKIYVNMGVCYGEMGDSDKELKCYEYALLIFEKTHGPEHLHVANTQDNIENVLADQGKLPESLEMYNKALKTRITWLPLKTTSASCSRSRGSFLRHSRCMTRHSRLALLCLALRPRTWLILARTLASSCTPKASFMMHLGGVQWYKRSGETYATTGHPSASEMDDLCQQFSDLLA